MPKRFVKPDEIAQTSDIEEFHSVNETAYQAVILRRSKAEKDALRGHFLDHAQDQKKYGHIVHSTIGENGHVEMELPEFLEPAREELEGMSKTYHELTGITEIKTELSKLTGGGLGMHQHPYHTLNCVWGDSGTMIQGTERDYTVPEGDYLFFKRNVMHGPTALDSENRVSVVVQPEDAKKAADMLDQEAREARGFTHD